MRKLVILMIFLGTMSSISYAHDSNLNKRIAFYVNGGRSRPIGDFDADAKAAFNWGGGIEYQFTPSWSAGASAQKINFGHKDVLYDPWNRAWRYADWSFFAINLYGRYSLMRKSLSPYAKLGIALYSIESKNISMEKPDDKNRNEFKNRENTISIIPALGFRYSTKGFFLFAEANYNITPTTHFGGERVTYQTSQFLNFLLGVGLPFDI